MKRRLTMKRSLVAALLGGLALVPFVAATPRIHDGERPEPVSITAPVTLPAWATTAVEPKRLSENVERGLSYLAGQQNADGGWGQGGGWRTSDKGGRVEGVSVQDPSDVANTCVATLALVRAGNSPKQGEYAKPVIRAVEFLCNQIEKSDTQSLFITDLRGTQVQSKIGPYVDTFLASLVLSELKGRMHDEKSEKRLVAALNKTVAKIERNQREDGTFGGNGGWASILSQGLAGKGLNRARQAGAQVSDLALDRVEKQVAGNFDSAKREFRGSDATTGSTDAGVKLYSYSAQASALQDRANSDKDQEKKARATLSNKSASKTDRAYAEQTLQRIERTKELNEAASRSITKQLDDQKFVQGVGSNGGEEFLSYMNISETLLVKGGEEWQKWDKSISENLNRVQNKDGSWSGHHCITGRTFCTATALLVLMGDRTPIPVAVTVEKGNEK